MFEQYQFTVEESTPADAKVAFDPELLDKVFENLFATYNPETGSQDRKATGGFYTPREIVSYMVDESLKQHFKTHTDSDENQADALFVEGENTLKQAQVKEVIEVIDNLKNIRSCYGKWDLLDRYFTTISIYFRQYRPRKYMPQAAATRQS